MCGLPGYVEVKEVGPGETATILWTDWLTATLEISRAMGQAGMGVLRIFQDGVGLNLYPFMASHYIGVTLCSTGHMAFYFPGLHKKARPGTEEFDEEFMEEWLRVSIGAVGLQMITIRVNEADVNQARPLCTKMRAFILSLLPKDKKHPYGPEDPNAETDTDMYTEASLQPFAK